MDSLRALSEEFVEQCRTLDVGKEMLPSTLRVHFESTEKAAENIKSALWMGD